MSTPLFAVSLADLERGPKEVVWAIPEGWLRHAFTDTDATPVGAGELDAELTKSGREVVVQGRARATVTLPDAVTNEPVQVELAPEIMLLLAPAPEPAPGMRGRRAARKASRKHGEQTAAGRAPEKGKAKSIGKSAGWAEDPELSDKDAGRDTYAGEQVVLDGFVREFLLLELPMTVHSDLPLAGDPAIAPPSAEPEAGEPRPLDPRLAPLAAIASRLRQNKE